MDIIVGDFSNDFLFDLFFAFFFHQFAGQHNFGIISGGHGTFGFGFVFVGHLYFSPDIINVLPREFEWAIEARAAHLDDVFFAHPAIGIDMAFEEAAEFLAFLEGHTGVTVDKNVKPLAVVAVFNFYGETIGEEFFGDVFFF